MPKFKITRKKVRKGKTVSVRREQLGDVHQRLRHATVHATGDYIDALATAQEECKRLRKDNFKLATKVRKIESGNFDEFFTYTTLKVTLPPGGSAVQHISISREADFYVTKMVRTGKDFSFLVRDSSNDRQWSNIMLDAEVGAGTASLPFILPKPRFVARAANLTIEFVNQSKTRANTVSLAFIGYKIYHVELLR